MSEVIGVFVLVLVISILAGMTFLFTSSLKTQAYSSGKILQSAIGNESLTAVDEIGDDFSVSWRSEVACTLLNVTNATSALQVPSTNYTQTNCNLKSKGADSGFNNTNWRIYYTYTYYDYGNAYDSVNKTEESGATIINYLPLLFLAIIFGAILAVVLKIILPYINLGNQVSGF